MGRAKIALEFITKEKARNTTYQKRKKGLIKKGHEFSILCNVPVCIIIYPYKDGKQSFEPEVYAFSPSSKKLSNDNPKSDQEVAREIIQKYLAIPKEEKHKRALNLYDMFDEWKRRADQELTKLRHKNALAKYPTWNSTLDGFNADQLMELLVHLDQKLDIVKQRIDMINKGSHQNHHLSSLLTFDHHGIIEASPCNIIPSMSIPSNNHTSAPTDMELFNKYTWLNYPTSHNDNQEHFHQMVPFDPSGFTDQAPDHHGDGSNGNFIMYNMNMLGMPPFYYDQGSEYADNAAAMSSSYSPGLPMSSMPFQELPLLPAGPALPKQYQMFFK